MVGNKEALNGKAILWESKKPLKSQSLLKQKSEWKGEG